MDTILPKKVDKLPLATDDEAHSLLVADPEVPEFHETMYDTPQPEEGTDK